MAESEEALQLKRRARRRLVGAIALVTFVVIILPLVLDKEPGPAGPSLEVQIPRQESSGFATRVVPPAPQMPAAPATEKKAEIPPVNAGPPPAKTETSPAKSETSPAKSEREPAAKAAKAQALPAEKTEQGRAQAALGDQTWVVTLDAFSDAKNVHQLRSRLSAAGVKSYTEPVKTGKGELTRVRAGPFASREAAEKTRAKLEAMGLKPGAVASR
ncbi:MAG: SPOR domain-containing protein [Pseudomonadota bacterium]